MKSEEEINLNKGSGDTNNYTTI